MILWFVKITSPWKGRDTNRGGGMLLSEEDLACYSKLASLCRTRGDYGNIPSRNGDKQYLDSESSLRMDGL